MNRIVICPDDWRLSRGLLTLVRRPDGGRSALPLTVHRPSMLVGDSASGRIIYFQAFLSPVRIPLGAEHPRPDTEIRPGKAGHRPRRLRCQDHRLVDYDDDQRRRRILHSCSGPDLALPLYRLRDRVRQAYSLAGRRLPPVINLPTGVFRAILTGVTVLMTDEARRAVRTLPPFLDCLATDRAFANRDTQQLVADAGLPVPDLEQYLDRVLHYHLDAARAD